MSENEINNVTNEETTLPFEMDEVEDENTTNDAEKSVDSLSEVVSQSDSIASNTENRSYQNSSQPQTSYSSGDARTSDSKAKGAEFKNTVVNYAISMYQYAVKVKNAGHGSVADLMFKDLMTIIISTNTASEAIGREKFISVLEDGYYASSRMIEYMSFMASIGIINNMYEPLMENNIRIHRAFSSSLKTTRNKKQTVNRPANVGM